MPYETAWRAGEGKAAANHLALRKAMEKLSDEDMDHIFNCLIDSDLRKVMDGNYASVVAKIIAGRPQLLGSLSALVGK